MRVKLHAISHGAASHMALRNGLARRLLDDVRMVPVRDKKRGHAVDGALTIIQCKHRPWDVVRLIRLRVRNDAAEDSLDLLIPPFNLTIRPGIIGCC